MSTVYWYRCIANQTASPVLLYFIGKTDTSLGSALHPQPSCGPRLRFGLCNYQVDSQAKAAMRHGPDYTITCGV